MTKGAGWCPWVHGCFLKAQHPVSSPPSISTLGWAADADPRVRAGRGAVGVFPASPLLHGACTCLAVKCPEVLRFGGAPGEGGCISEGAQGGLCGR